MGIGRVRSAARLAAFLFLFPGLLLAEGAGSVCARVKIQLKQEAIMARTAFDAGLRVDNSEGTVPVPNLAVELQIDDITEDPMVTLTPQEVEERFYIAPPDLGGEDGMSDISALDGSQSLPAGKVAEARWRLIPRRQAAPISPWWGEWIQVESC